MNLAARGAGRQREDFVMRLGCFLVTFAVLASLVLDPPRAKAFAMTSSAVTALAGGFLSACGLTPVVSGMGSSEEVNESVARLIQDFLNEEVGGISVADWALSFGEIGLAVKDKRIVIPKPFADKLGEFARWVAGKYGTKPGVSQVYMSDLGFPLADGTMFYFCTLTYVDGSRNPFISNLGTNISDLDTVVFSNGSYLTYKDRFVYVFDESDSYLFSADFSHAAHREYDGIYFAYDPKYAVYVIGDANSDYLFCTHARGISISMFGDALSSGLSLDVSDTMQQVLDRLTALEEGQSIALDVGATQSMEIQEILQGILDAILAGDLAASAEIVDEAEVPVDPDPPPVVPVVPSGLDKLGAALTSRFPFSIPWDVYKGVTLLAAPPKAPYFEVDFMAPIADRVGGWKGSTKVVLDFSEYEIIGQVCRWTSTIGFCLMLASGTKRLIWTA